ncbi:unnamed protein product, partial [Medioppia subpectinata]
MVVRHIYRRKGGASLSDYCNIPGSVYDKTAPCETPSDVIYVIDAHDLQSVQRSADIVAATNSYLTQIRAGAGAITIFINSLGGNDVNNQVWLPQGTWPLVPVVFNSTNTGCSQCRINDFNQTQKSVVKNTGAFFRALNTTLFNYEWWTPRTNDSAIPAKSAVIIDFGSMTAAPDSGTDRDDYNYFKDQLRYRHRDVRFLPVANDQKLFEDIVPEGYQTDAPGGDVSQIGRSLAQKIC